MRGIPRRPSESIKYLVRPGRYLADIWGHTGSRESVAVVGWQWPIDTARRSMAQRSDDATDKQGSVRECSREKMAQCWSNVYYNWPGLSQLFVLLNGCCSPPFLCVMPETWLFIAVSMACRSTCARPFWRLFKMVNLTFVRVLRLCCVHNTKLRNKLFWIESRFVLIQTRLYNCKAKNQ